MAAAVALVDESRRPEYALGTGIDEDGIAYWASFLLEQTTPEQRQEWESAVDQVLGSGEAAFVDWADWLFACANRFALAISGDLASAMKAMKSESSDGRTRVVSGPETFRGLLVDVPAIARLHSYAFGPEYWAARQSGD